MIDLSPKLVDSPITAPEPTITWSPISTLSEILQKEPMVALGLILAEEEISASFEIPCCCCS